VNGRVDRLRELGGNVQAVTVDEDGTAPAAALDLLPSERRGERESARERLVQRSLGAAVAILLALALLIPIWRKRETVIKLLPMVERAHQQAEAASRVSARLEREVGDYNFLLSRKYSNYPVLAFVEEFTRLLPDNTWLQQMVINTSGRGREIQITGETASSSRLIEILEQSKLMHNATPRGAVTRGSPPNTERFIIAAEASPRPAPEAMPVLQGPAPPAPAARPSTAAPPAPAAQPAHKPPAKPGPPAARK
jgi:general secretion pathway protein L